MEYPPGTESTVHSAMGTTARVRLGICPQRTHTLVCCGTGRGDRNVFRDNVRNAETSTEHSVCREEASAEVGRGQSVGRWEPRGEGYLFS